MQIVSILKSNTKEPWSKHKYEMSLYNLINGKSSLRFFLLPMLGCDEDDFPRYRDVYVTDDVYIPKDGERNILVLTRAGGYYNRDAYEEEIEECCDIPGYVTDYDVDSTYATFVYKVPEEFHDDFDTIINIYETDDVSLEKLYNSISHRLRLCVDSFYNVKGMLASAANDPQSNEVETPNAEVVEAENDTVSDQNPWWKFVCNMFL